MKKPEAIVIDDEWYNLEEIADLINKTGSLEVKSKYQNPIIALQEFEEAYPDVAFIDVDMPEISGTILAEKFLEINPSIIIVFITAWKQYAAQAFDLNATDYIVKPIRQDRFDAMVRKIEEKLVYAKEKTVCTDVLTKREVEVITLISQGLTHNQLALRLMVSVSAVKRCTENIYHKLGVNNKIMAIKQAEKLNII